MTNAQNSGAVELLPCPFCGGVGDIESQPSYSQAANTYDRYRGWCDQCGFGLDWHGHEADAIAAWNTRTTPAPSDQAGWQLVPIDLTQAMLDATCCTAMDDEEMRRTWAELLRTAPTLTAGEGGGDE